MVFNGKELHVTFGFSCTGCGVGVPCGGVTEGAGGVDFCCGGPAPARGRGFRTSSFRRNGSAVLRGLYTGLGAPGVDVGVGVVSTAFGGADASAVGADISH